MSARNRKYTVMLPEQLVERAKRAAKQKNITPVIERGLELVANEAAYERVLALEGRVSFSLDYNALRDEE